MNDLEAMQRREAQNAAIANEWRKQGLCPVCGRKVCNATSTMRTMNGDRQ